MHAVTEISSQFSNWLFLPCNCVCIALAVAGCRYLSVTLSNAWIIGLSQNEIIYCQNFYTIHLVFSQEERLVWDDPLCLKF